VTLPPSVAGRVVNVSGEPDITPVLLLADAMITDYSSVMFDYSLLQRPMVFFTYDWEEYVNNSRGTYFDLSEQAPGPVVRTAEELFDVLTDLDALASDQEGRLKEFVTQYGEYDRGDAAAQIVDRFFGNRGDAR
jgi:CDP-glycerol glycerophosphotransferase